MRENNDVVSLDGPTVVPLNSASSGGEVIKTPQWKMKLRRVLYPIKFGLSLAGFLTIIVYLLGASIIQGIGMIAMGLVFPTFMRLVYPSRLGKVHTWVLGVYRKCALPEQGHSRSIRIDLEATATSADDDLGVGVGSGDGDGSVGGESSQDGAELHQYSVHTVACLLDNYAYIIVDKSGPPNRPRAVALVDPCEARAVTQAIKALEEGEYAGCSFEVTAILTTHHHWDHAGGNRALAKRYPGVRVYGSIEDSVDSCTHTLYDGDRIQVGGLTVRVLHAPCHTRGSLCFILDGPTPALFGGDTLFCGGCGAPFEGTENEMKRNFVKIWRSCPTNTLVFPGHEYARAILPGYFSGQTPLPAHPSAFGKLCSLLWRAQRMRSLESPIPTVPLVLANELAINANFMPLREAALTLCRAYRQYKAFEAHRSLSAEDGNGSAAEAKLGGGVALSAPAGANGHRAAGPATPPPSPPDAGAGSGRVSCGTHAGEIDVTIGERNGEAMIARLGGILSAEPPLPPETLDELRLEGPPEAVGATLSAASPSASAPQFGRFQPVPSSAQSTPRTGHGDGLPQSVDGIGSLPIDPMLSTQDSSFWSAGMLVIPADQFQMLEDCIVKDFESLKRGGAHDATLLTYALLERFRANGLVPPKSADEGCPTNARVAHAHLPRRMSTGEAEDKEKFGVVTTDETERAFNLLAAAAADGYTSDALIRRAVTSPLLLPQPLQRREADELLTLAGVDTRGLVSCKRFNERLCVLPPMPEPEAKPGRLRRLACWLLRPFGFGKQESKHVKSGLVSPQSEPGELTELNEDLGSNLGAHHGVRDVLRPRSMEL